MAHIRCFVRGTIAALMLGGLPIAATAQVESRPGTMVPWLGVGFGFGVSGARCDCDADLMVPAFHGNLAAGLDLNPRFSISVERLGMAPLLAPPSTSQVLLTYVAGFRLPNAYFRIPPRHFGERWSEPMQLELRLGVGRAWYREGSGDRQVDGQPTAMLGLQGDSNWGNLIGTMYVSGFLSAPHTSGGNQFRAVAIVMGGTIGWRFRR